MLVQTRAAVEGTKVDIVISAAEFDDLLKNGATEVSSLPPTMGFPNGIANVRVTIGQ